MRNRLEDFFIGLKFGTYSAEVIANLVLMLPFTYMTTVFWITVFHNEKVVVAALGSITIHSILFIVVLLIERLDPT